MATWQFLLGLGSVSALSLVSVLPALAETGNGNPDLTAAPAAAIAINQQTVQEQDLPRRQDQPQASPARDLFPLFVPRVGVRSSTAEAGGNPFAVIEGFVPLAQSRGRDLLFMEGRQFYDLAEGTAGRNFLLGYRSYDPKSDRVWGGYLAYDNRDTGNSLFDQIGVGLESVGKHWDLRLNGYLPIGNTRDQVLEVYASGGQFQGNALLVERARVFESALGGFDAEVGMPLARWDAGQLKGYAGVYYLGGSGGSETVGVRGRLQAQINDLTAVGFTLEQDDLFDTRAIVNIGLTFRQTPKGRGDRNLEISAVIASLGSRVQRSTSIAVNSNVTQDVTIARNPETGQPLTFRHVDLGNGTGTGSIENPFGSLEAALAAARPGDIVRVGAATDTTLGELRVPDQVNVVAAAMPTAVATRQAARVALPRAANTGRITVNGPITLESNGTVSGLIINANNNHGVIGNNVTGVASIVDNTINVTGEFDGINITNTGGSVDLTIARNEINGARNGIFINTQEGAQATLNISDNRINDARELGLLLKSEGNSTVNARLDRNTLTRNRGGIELSIRDRSFMDASVTNNVIAGNLADDGSGFAVGRDPKAAIRSESFNNSRGTLTIVGNQLTDARSNAISFGNRDDAQLSATITDNTITNTLGNGIFFGSTVNAQVSTTIANNTVSDTQLNDFFGPLGIPSGNGVFFVAQLNAFIDAEVRDNTLTDNQGSGIFYFIGNEGIGNARITGNTITGSRVSGIDLNVGLNPAPEGVTPPLPPLGTLQGTVLVANNTVINNRGEGPPPQEGAGIVARTFNNSAFQLEIRDNTLRGNASAPTALGDIGLVALDNSRFLNPGIHNNRIESEGEVGISLFNVTGDITIAHNRITFPALGDDPILGFETVNGVPNPIRNSCGGICFLDSPFPADFDPSTGGKSGIRYFSFANGTTNLALLNNTISQASSSGVLVGSAGAGELNVRAEGNDASDNRGSGLFMFALGNGILNGTILNNTTNNNQGRIFNESGIRFVTFDNAVMTGTFRNNTANDNRGNGIFFALNDNSLGSGEIRDNVTNRNVGNGIFFGTRRTADGTAVITGNRSQDNQINPDIQPRTFPNGAGISVGTQETGRITAEVADNTVSGNGQISGDGESTSPLNGNGISFFAIANSRLTATARNNTVTGNTPSGIGVTIGDSSQGTVAFIDNVSTDNAASGIEANVGIFTGPPALGNAPLPPPPPLLNVTITGNRVQGNDGGGPSEQQGGAGIMLRAFNRGLMEAVVEGNTATNFNGVAPVSFAGGIGGLALDSAAIEARVRFNEMAENSTKPGFVARSLGSSRFCLRLEDNHSDITYALAQLDTSVFQADTGGNSGPPVVRIGRIPGLGNCPTP